jgi:uncharacterized metal-binding protein
MSEKVMSDCAACTLAARDRVCLSPAAGKGGKGCPTLVGKKLIQKAAETYRQEEVLEFARQASIQEGEGYANRDRRPFVLHPVKPRILEICEFSRKMGYNRLGLAFCAGLVREATLDGTDLSEPGVPGRIRHLQGWRRTEGSHRSFG